MIKVTLSIVLAAALILFSSWVLLAPVSIEKLLIVTGITLMVFIWIICFVILVLMFVLRDKK